MDLLGVWIINGYIIMKRFIITIAAALFAGLAFAPKEIPAGIRMEIAEVEQNEDEICSLFTYKDADGTYGYYLSVGRDRTFAEFTAGRTSGAIGWMDETCLCLGATADEAAASLDALLAMFDEPVGCSQEFKCRTPKLLEDVGEYSTATGTLVKIPLVGKRIRFEFGTGRKTREADLSKSTVKTMRSSLKLHRKLHPGQK